MKRLLVLIGIISLLLLITACKQDAPAMGDAVLIVDGDGSNLVEDVKDFELHLKDGILEPTTIVVNEGDHVRLFLKNTDVIVFESLPFNVFMNMRHGMIEFDADQKGEFAFYCADCDEGRDSVLKVI